MAEPLSEGGGESPPGCDNQGKVIGSYAKIAGGQSSGRKKLNVLDIMLERKDNTVNFNLNKEELSKLLFKKMKINPKDVRAIDTSGFGKIHVELNSNVDPENFVALAAFDIREGLRTKFYKPHHTKESLVTISWMDLETPDDLLIHILNHFGHVKSNVRWMKIKEEEGETELEKLLNNISNGIRQVWMEISKPLPSYAMIDRRKVKIYHPGQRRTCARCHKVADLCRGNSNAKLCEDNGGEKINVAEAWRNTLETVNYIEWNGGEIEIVEETDDEKGNSDEEIHMNITNCDGFILSNLEENATMEEIKTIIKGAAPEDIIQNISMHPTGSTRSKIIKDIDVAYVHQITKKVNQRSFKGRLIHCRPHVPVTPPKKEIYEKPGDQKEDTVKEKEDSKLCATTLSPIPGLPKEEMEKALKKKETKKRGRRKLMSRMK